MSTPYVTPQMLKDAPLGISWSTIPGPKADGAAQLAAQFDIATRASDMVDAYCNQPLRATVDVEQIFGPDYRLTIEPNGTVHAETSRFPIISILAARITASASFPRQWTPVDLTKIDFDQSLMPLQGTSAVSGAAAAAASGVYLAPGLIDWGYGRRGAILELTYENGWPHSGLTANAAVAATTLTVDDVTGFKGAIARIYDGEFTETITVTSTSTTYGPGTLTLAAPTVNAHSKGVCVSSLPGTVQQATMYFAAHVALERGATALTVQSVPGSEDQHHAPDYATEAEIMLQPYKRVI